MTDALKEKCELLAGNRSLIRRGFLFEKEQMSTAAALILTVAGIEADIE